MDVYPLEALKEALFLVGEAANNLGTAWRIGLYGNDVTPGPSTNLAALVPAAFAGYADQGVGGPGTVDDDGAGHGRLTTLARTFTVTASSPGSKVYGWYIWRPDESHLVAVQRWPGAPLPMDTAGQFATVVPRILAESLV